MPREQREPETVNVYNTVKPFIVFTNNAAGIYILWIFMHFISAHLYVYYCTHYSLQGFILSPILVSAPHCRALRWVIYNGTQSIDSMWIVFGAWLCSKLALIGGENGAR